MTETEYEFIKDVAKKQEKSIGLEKAIYREILNLAKLSFMDENNREIEPDVIELTCQLKSLDEDTFWSAAKSEWLKKMFAKKLAEEILKRADILEKKTFFNYGSEFPEGTVGIRLYVYKRKVAEE